LVRNPLHNDAFLNIVEASVKLEIP